MKKIKEFVQKIGRKGAKNTAFTLAEILVTLSIIGVVSALTIPALLASVDEKVYLTQKKALTARLTTAISQLDKLSGYGSTPDDYSEAFIIELSQVYKLNSICDSSDVTACDVPSKVLKLDGSTKIDLLNAGAKTALTLNELNSKFDDAHSTEGGITYYRNSKPAAFTTVNGESVLVYYNPRCTGATGAQQPVQQIMCVNMVYDLNGTKSPNQVGKDIGFITVFSNRDSVVAGIVPDMNDYLAGTTKTFSYADAVANCEKNLAKRVADIDELGSLFTNSFLLGTAGTEYQDDGLYWSGSAVSVHDGSAYSWAQNFATGDRIQEERATEGSVRCVAR